VVVVTHSAALQRSLLEAESGVEVHAVELAKDSGETVIRGQGLLDRPSWQWPQR
jgi:predicted ATPase